MLHPAGQRLQLRVHTAALRLCRHGQRVVHRPQALQRHVAHPLLRIQHSVVWEALRQALQQLQVRGLLRVEGLAGVEVGEVGMEGRAGAICADGEVFPLGLSVNGHLKSASPRLPRRPQAIRQAHRGRHCSIRRGRQQPGVGGAVVGKARKPERRAGGEVGGAQLSAEVRQLQLPRHRQRRAALRQVRRRLRQFLSRAVPRHHLHLQQRRRVQTGDRPGACRPVAQQQREQPQQRRCICR
mmetsp:Transcript_24863/g.64522  ORF Transcript_24863/g.64522 Transcript_24863/m.64522 type:complete len:240 (+) Transcript_24863:417-1136(+)